MDKVDVRTQQSPRRPTASLPRNAAERAEALFDLMERLIAVLDRETAAVQRQDTGGEFTRLVQDKQPLVMAYEELARLLRVDRDGLKALPAPVKQRLQEMTRRLSEASATNANALKANGDAQKIVVDTMVGAVNHARQSQPGFSYGPSAAGYGRGLARNAYPTPQGKALSGTLFTKL
jgi:hypothetical protein